MKKISIYFMLLLIAFAFACQPEAFKPMGEKLAKAEALQGTWVLKQLIQADEKPQFGLEEMDITELMPFTDITLTFGTGGALTVNYGSAPELIPNATTWQLVDNDGAENITYPTKLKLDDTMLDLESVAFQTEELKFYLKLSDNSSAVYHYTFVKQ